MRYAILVTGPLSNHREMSKQHRDLFQSLLILPLPPSPSPPLTPVPSDISTGPAGSGKSTFCSSIITHAASLNRNIHLFNLDPAADKFEYPPTIDIRDLISLQDVMEEMEFGPNGGLIYCFE